MTSTNVKYSICLCKYRNENTAKSIIHPKINLSMYVRHIQNAIFYTLNILAILVNYIFYQTIRWGDVQLNPGPVSRKLTFYKLECNKYDIVVFSET